MENTYTVGELMIQNIKSIQPDETLLTCAQTMARERIGSLLVMEKNQLVGIITEQDLARKVLAQNINPEKGSVRNIMSTQLTTVTPEEDIHTAVRLMGSGEVKHLPVVSKGTVQGIITFKDIIQIEPALIDLIRFKNSQ